jgi:hypothetical protein
LSRLDALRSLMRGAVSRAGEGLGKLGGLGEARRILAELAKKRLLVPEAAVTAAVARAHGVESAAAQIRDGAVFVDAFFTDGDHLQVRLEPGAPTFAPRGPKELVFHVSPLEAARSRHLHGVVSALSTAVAHALWAVALPRGDADVGAIVDREGEDRLRVDLRSVPAVRELLGRGSAGAIVELLELAGLECERGELRLELKLPSLG